MDNLFKKCPAVMADGRFITNYNVDSAITQDIRKKYNLFSTHDFRDFLQINAQNLMKENFMVNGGTCHPNIKCSYGYPPRKTYSKIMDFKQTF